MTTAELNVYLCWSRKWKNKNFYLLRKLWIVSSCGKNDKWKRLLLCAHLKMMFNLLDKYYSTHINHNMLSCLNKWETKKRCFDWIKSGLLIGATINGKIPLIFQINLTKNFVIIFYETFCLFSIHVLLFPHFLLIFFLFLVFCVHFKFDVDIFMRDQSSVTPYKFHSFFYMFRILMCSYTARKNVLWWMCKCVVKCLQSTGGERSEKKMGDLIYVMRPHCIYSFVDFSSKEL